MAVDGVMAASSPSLMSIWFSFEGRLNRSAYWLKYVLPAMVLLVMFSFLDRALGTMAVDPASGQEMYGMLTGIYSFVLLWPSFATGAKRCHDRGRSGWFQLLYLIPIIGAIVLFVYIGFLKGTDGPNRFGPDPLAA